MTKAPDKQFQFLLILVVAFNLIPHTFTLPPWTTASAALLMVWAGMHLYRGWALPNSWVRTGLAALGAGAVALQWQTIVGQEPATALLIILASLKLLESTRYRDAMLMIFTTYFLLMAHLLDSQSLPSTLFMACDIMLITALMFQLNKRDRRGSIRSFRPAIRLLSLALPVWIFLFIAFPRFSTAWRPSPTPPPGTGFSDDINPGDVAKLTESSEVAFRASFKNTKLPSQENMYWRGAVLPTVSQGLHWSRAGVAVPKETIVRGGARSPLVRQEIVLEPGHRKWLFALDVPRRLELDISQKNVIQSLPGFTFQSAQESEGRILYEALSMEEAQQQELGDEERALYLLVPPDVGPDVVELARRLRSETDNSLGRKVHRVLDYFVAEGFRYTKSPGPSRTGSLAEFLFSKRRGFCEHYAAAFATLVRLMDVPSRVVVGFLGGSLNTYGGYVMVRNLDAHAWTEVWSDEQKRWLRVDPTSRIQPLRSHLGGDFNLIELEQYSGMTSEMIQAKMRGSSLWRLRSSVAEAWDATTMSWANFLMQYDFDYQQNIFGHLGLTKANRVIFFIWISVGVIIFIVILQFFLRRRSDREDPLLANYHRFCNRLAKVGLVRRPNEGPLQFISRAKRFRPALASELDEIGQEFIALRYGPLGASEETTPPKIARFIRRDRHAHLRRFRRLTSSFRVE